jgi:hypothetical protein
MRPSRALHPTAAAALPHTLPFTFHQPRYLLTYLGRRGASALLKKGTTHNRCKHCELYTVIDDYLHQVLTTTDASKVLTGKSSVRGRVLRAGRY